MKKLLVVIFVQMLLGNIQLSGSQAQSMFASQQTIPEDRLSEVVLKKFYKKGRGYHTGNYAAKDRTVNGLWAKLEGCIIDAMVAHKTRAANLARFAGLLQEQVPQGQQRISPVEKDREVVAPLIHDLAEVTRNPALANITFQELAARYAQVYPNADFADRSFSWRLRELMVPPVVEPAGTKRKQPEEGQEDSAPKFLKSIGYIDAGISEQALKGALLIAEQKHFAGKRP